MRAVAIAMLNSLLVLPINLSGAEVRSQTVRDQSSPQSSWPVPKIEVRLSLPRTSIASGAHVLVKVDLLNSGDEPIFLPTKVPLNSWGDPGNLQVGLWDKNGHGFGGIEGGGDRGWPPKEDFYKLIFENWVVLFPGHSYGTTVDITYAAFRGIFLKPGRYRIEATYSAFGMGSKNMNNPLGAYLDRVPSLPYASWEGEFKCKPIWVEITPAPLHANRPDKGSILPR